MADKEMLVIKKRKGRLEDKWRRAEMESVHPAVARGAFRLPLCAVPPATTTIPITGTTTMGFVCVSAPRPIMPGGLAGIAWQRLIPDAGVLRNTGLVFGHDMRLFYQGNTPLWREKNPNINKKGLL